jgi:hypothetical protein
MKLLVLRFASGNPEYVVTDQVAEDIVQALEYCVEHPNESDLIKIEDQPKDGWRVAGESTRFGEPRNRSGSLGVVRLRSVECIRVIPLVRAEEADNA